ncbi:Uncharacterised protein [Candidatus Norongarragalina meridionalis]|nr:Uncharacterised protein [Candidatus Norongarragalina meridionalis]
MNFLLLLALAAIAFWAMQEGMIFIAFIVLIVAVIGLLAGAGKGEVVSGVPGEAAAAQQYAQEIPDTFRIKVKSPWADTFIVEDWSSYTGEIMDTVGGTLFRLFGGKTKRRPPVPYKPGH